MSKVAATTAENSCCSGKTKKKTKKQKKNTKKGKGKDKYYKRQ